MQLSRISRATVDRLAPVLVAAMAWGAGLSSIDPAGSYPTAPQGPGLTLDESFNVQQGVRLIEAARLFGWGVLHPQSLQEVFGGPDDLKQQPPFGYHLPDHPPLGRLWIGVGHHLAKSWFPPHNPETPFVTACARTASATAFALLVLLVGCTARRWYGLTGGLSAAISLLLMPRLFGHARLAALETFIGLTYTAAVFSVAAYWSPEVQSPVSRVPSQKHSGSRLWTLDSRLFPAWTGAVFGLALLTKIQAVLLAGPIVLWAVYHRRRRALVPLLIWAASGLLVFILFWPWLWLDPIGHIRDYLGRSTDRAQLFAWYLGERLTDLTVPWHYPFVMFLVTVPVGLHLLGFWGLLARNGSSWLQPREQIVLACLLFPLIVFALPGIPVYDGARLFLVAFPLWGVLIGRGASLAVRWASPSLDGDRRARSPLRGQCPRWMVRTVLGLFLTLQGYGLVALWPCHLSYYNLFVGGLPGAERLGFELSYWGDGVTREFLERSVRTVPQGASLHVAPVLHQFQLQALRNQSPILRRHGIQLRPFHGFDDPSLTHVLLFQRRADLPASLRPPPPDARLLTEVRRQGVQLAALYAVNVPKR